MTEAGAAVPSAPWGEGRSGLVVAGLMLGFAVYLTVGILTMQVPAGAEAPGPRFYPTIVAIAAYALAVVLALRLLRHPEGPEDPAGLEPVAGQWRTYTDWRAVALAVLAFALFAVLLEPLGWILAAGLLFFLIAWALGSRRVLFDLCLAVVVSSAVQVAFSMGLGLNLPSGILGGAL